MMRVEGTVLLEGYFSGGGRLAFILRTWSV